MAKGHMLVLKTKQRKMKMKKIMIAVVAVALAFVANAASVNWSVSGVTAPEGGTLASGWYACFVEGSALPTDMAAMTAGDWATWTGANATSEGTLAVTARAKTFSGSTADTYAADSAVTGYIVMFDAANVADASNFAYTEVATKNVPSAGNLTWSQTFATTSGWQAVAVPEPTSGLLMLVGLAGLALRRRRA